MKRLIPILLLSICSALAQKSVIPVSSIAPITAPCFVPMYVGSQNGTPIIAPSALCDTGSQLLYNGSPVGGGGASVLQQAVVVVTDAQFLAMTDVDVNDVQIVPNPGVNKLILPLSYIVQYKPGSTAFTNASNGSFGFFPGSYNTDDTQSFGFSFTMNNLSGGGGTTPFLFADNSLLSSASDNPTIYANKPLNLGMIQSNIPLVTGGTGSSFVFTLYYTIVTLQ